MAVLAVVVSLSYSAASKHANAQTLDEALNKAYINNPTIRAQRARLRATDEQVPRALSNWRPTVTFTAEAGKSNVTTKLNPTAGTDVLTNSENRTPKNFTLALSQPLFRGFRTLAETRRAEHRISGDRARLESIEQGVFEDGVEAYMDVLRDQAVLQFNINNEQVLRRQLEATTDRFEVGEVTRTDVSQAEARLARATADRIQAEGNLESSRAVYQRIIGELPGTLTEPGQPAGLPTSLDELLAQAAVANPDVRAAVADEKAALEDVDLVLGELLPTMSLNGELSRFDDESARSSRTDTVEVRAQVVVPLYQAGSVSARVREAKQVASQRRVQIEEARRQVIEDAIDAWEDLTTAQARVLSFEKETSANTIALEGTEQEATAGLRTVLDILDAEQELLDSQVNLIRAKRDVIVAAYRVLESAGRLSAQDLALSVELYDPTSHYKEVRDQFFGIDVEGE